MSQQSTMAASTFNVSSSATVFLKYFLPTIWIVFFGTLAFVFLFADNFRVGSLSPMAFKVGYMSFFLGIIVLMYFTIFKLKRVEFDEEAVYITNYIKTYRYPLASVASIKEYDYKWWLVYKLRLKQAGYFGEKITFLANRKRLNQFMDTHPSVAQAIPLDE